MPVRFGDCVLDAETRQLFVEGKEVHLQPKAFQLLELLIQNRPRVLSKKSLMEALWPDTFVAEGSLTRLAAELRGAIGDDARKSRFVRTVHRFGYAFHGQATPMRQGPASGSVFKLIWGEREIPLSEGENVLGRDPASAARIDVASVSRHHAKIVVTGQDVSIEDLGSKNGTQVEGRRIQAATPLRDGDSIQVGSVPLVLRRFGPGGTTESMRSR